MIRGWLREELLDTLLRRLRKLSRHSKSLMYETMNFLSSRFPQETFANFDQQSPSRLLQQLFLDIFVPVRKMLDSFIAIWNLRRFVWWELLALFFYDCGQDRVADEFADDENCSCDMFVLVFVMRVLVPTDQVGRTEK